MEKVDIFKDIAERTGGDIYLGVVGAVRTGNPHLLRNSWSLLLFRIYRQKLTVPGHRMNYLKVLLEKRS